MAYVVLTEAAPYVMKITASGNGVTLTSGKRYVVTPTVGCYISVSSSNSARCTSSNGHFIAGEVPWPPTQGGPLRMGSTLGNALAATSDIADGWLYISEAAER